jgi:CBS domain containing-hemolysin-like protein
LITATRGAILNARYGRLAALGEERGVNVDATLDLIKRRIKLRDSFRLTLTLLRFFIAGLVLSSVWPVGATWQSLSGILLATALLIWLGEFFVERRVQLDPETWSLRLGVVARILVAIASPLLAIPVAIARRGNGETQQLVTITENELKNLLDTGQQEGVLEQDERKMIFSIFQFGDTLAREIMVPRIDMFTLEVSTPVDDVVPAVLESGFSRVPVYRGAVDNIIGMLYTKDLLKLWGNGKGEDALKDLLRPANFIPESKKVDELLGEMQAERIHIAIVVDEYGGVAGLVTLEDIVEEIVGEIQDEYDQAEELPYQQISEDEYLFLGRIDLDDFNNLMDTDLSTDEADTLGGYLYSQIGRVPRAGESLEADQLRLTVEQITGRRIRKVRAQRLEQSTNEDDNAD